MIANQIFLMALFLFAMNIALGFFVWIKGKRILANRIFFIFSVFSGAYVLFYHLALIIPDGIIFGRLGFAAVVGQALFILLFVYIFPEKQKISFYKLAGFSALPVFFFFYVLSDSFLVKAEVINSHLVGNFGESGYSLFCAFIAVYLFLILYFLFRKYFSSNDHTRLQLRYVMAGFISFVVPTFITNLVLPKFFGIRDLNILGPFFTLFIVIFIGYAIVKHRLLNINVVIQRSLMYSVVLAVVVALYLTLVMIMGYFFQKTAQITYFISAILTIIIGIYGVPIIENAFRRMTDKIFFKNKYDFSQAVFELSRILNCNIKLPSLLEKSANRLEEILKIRKVIFILPEQNLVFDERGLNKMIFRFPKNIVKVIEKSNERYVILEDIPSMLSGSGLSEVEKGVLRQAETFGREHGAAFAAAILLEKKLVGILFLSAKQSGGAFTDEDIKLIDTFTHQAAIAIEKAKLYGQVKEYSRKLEEKVKQRTTRIKNLQEEQRQMMLEIGHGLQTPLTIIKGELSILQKNPEHPKQLKSLEKSIDRISKFIYDMLRLARLESSENKVIYEKVDLSGLVSGLIEDYEVITSEKGIKITSQIEAGLNIIGNKSHLDEMITNLVSNSVKYMAGCKEKKIAFSLEKKGKQARLIISDTGPGISREHLEMIFNRFYRLPNSTKEKGTGLGLSICKRIAEMHRGRIKLESGEGRGTAAIVDLPLAV